MRGPLKSETKEIKIPLGTATNHDIAVPIELIFSRITTMYRLSDGCFQRKNALIRMLQLVDGNEVSPGKRLAKIIAEV